MPIAGRRGPLALDNLNRSTWATRQTYCVADLGVETVTPRQLIYGVVEVRGTSPYDPLNSDDTCYCLRLNKPPRHFHKTAPLVVMRNNLERQLFI
jgi:hypothetical protein